MDPQVLWEISRWFTTALWPAALAAGITLGLTWAFNGIARLHRGKYVFTLHDITPHTPETLSDQVPVLVITVVGIAFIAFFDPLKAVGTGVVILWKTAEKILNSFDRPGIPVHRGGFRHHGSWHGLDQILAVTTFRNHIHLHQLKGVLGTFPSGDLGKLLQLHPGLTIRLDPREYLSDLHAAACVTLDKFFPRVLVEVEEPSTLEEFFTGFPQSLKLFRQFLIPPTERPETDWKVTPAYIAMELGGHPALWVSIADRVRGPKSRVPLALTFRTPDNQPPPMASSLQAILTREELADGTVLFHLGIEARKKIWSKTASPEDAALLAGVLREVWEKPGRPCINPERLPQVLPETAGNSF